jgi:hypothetical protein
MNLSENYFFECFFVGEADKKTLKREFSDSQEGFNLRNIMGGFGGSHG